MATQDTDEIQSITAPHHTLGRYISHHPSNRLRLLLRAGLFYALVTVILQILFARVDDATARLFLPILFALAALLAVWYAAHLWNREVILYEQGFTYQQGSQLGQFRYRDIVRVKPDMQRIAILDRFQRTRYNYVLLTDADEVLRISNLYSDIEKLVNRLEGFITRDRLPLIQQALDAGQSVDMGGGLRLSKSGLEYEGRELFWHEISGQRVKEGMLIIRGVTDSDWAALPVADLNNPVLLLAVLKQMISPQPPAPFPQGEGGA